MRTDPDSTVRWRWDLPVVLATAVVCLAAVTLETQRRADFTMPPALAVLVALASCALLLWRRRWPIPVAVLCGGSAIVMLGLHSHATVATILVATYTVARAGQRWAAAVLAVAVGVETTLATLVSQEWKAALVTATWMVGWLTIGVVIGDLQYQHRRRLRLADERAAAAERSRDELAAARAAEERIRIARELHDSLTHAISVVNVQSSVALHVLERQPEQAEAALRGIREASRHAMRELRATLLALRVADDGPTATIDALDDLVERSRTTDTRLTLAVPDALPELPDAVDRTVYRIVQEALTNAARHSNGDRVDIEVRHHDGGLRVSVSDNGSVPGPIVDGLGLIGMRERVTALGGRLSTLASMDGFTVDAWLPVTRTAPEPA